MNHVSQGVGIVRRPVEASLFARTLLSFHRSEVALNRWPGTAGGPDAAATTSYRPALEAADVVAVHQRIAWFAHPREYVFFDAAGAGLGTAHAPRTAVWSRLFSPSSWVIRDAAENEWGWVHKVSGPVGRPAFRLASSAGEVIGTASVENVVSSPRLQLSAADGWSASVTGGRGASWHWSVKRDDDGAVLATIDKTLGSLAESLNEAHTLVVRMHDGTDTRQRRLIVAACLCLTIAYDGRRRGQ